MKYTYNYKPKSDIIKNYKIEDENIEITYLDNSTGELLFTDDNEKMIKSIVFDQAKERDNSFEKNFLNTEKKNRLIVSSIMGGFVCLNMLVNNNQFDLSCIIANIMAGSYSLYNLLLSTINNKKLNDIDKYHIFLSLKKDLDEFISIVKKEKYFIAYSSSLSINTLDLYKKEELIKLRDMLNEYHFNDNDDLKLKIIKMINEKC